MFFDEIYKLFPAAFKYLSLIRDADFKDGELREKSAIIERQTTEHQRFESFTYTPLAVTFTASAAFSGTTLELDTTTGIHGFSIDLADNTTAGFYAAGSQYWVVVASITVDAATVNFVAATFRIGYPDAILDTTIATLASQTSFTLTSGPAEDDALNGRLCIIHDVASAVQVGHAVISDYTGSMLYLWTI